MILPGKNKIDQRQLSKNMVNAFRMAVDQVKKDSDQLNFCDKRKVLETFIENDEVLGQLLDFISAKDTAADLKNAAVSMTITDHKGNRLQK